MKKHAGTLGRMILLIIFTSSTLFTSLAEGHTPQAIEEAIPPGPNFDRADFRFWLPKDIGPVRAVVVLVPGSNGDGRPMADDAFWQAFATRQRVALVGCRFTDKPHDQAFIEDYVNVSRGCVAPDRAPRDGVAGRGQRA